MTNIASVLKAEVARLTRKELKVQLEPLRKQIVSQRKTIATLRSDFAKLQRNAVSNQRNVRKPLMIERTQDAPATRARFSASGLKKLRLRLGLSREAFAPLLGVSGQTIYFWESGQSNPRQASIEKIAIVRGMTKQQADNLLAQHKPTKKPKAKPAPKSSTKKTAKTKVQKSSLKKAKKAVEKPTVPRKADKPTTPETKQPPKAQRLRLIKNSNPPAPATNAAASKAPGASAA